LIHGVQISLGGTAILLGKSDAQPGEAVAVDQTFPDAEFFNRQRVSIASLFER
jgi:hypothetical protein